MEEYGKLNREHEFKGNSMGIIDWLTSKKRPPKTANAPENIDKPEIVVLLRPHPSSMQILMLCIKNIGTETAHNVRFGTGSSRAAPFIQPASNLSDVRLLKKNNFLQNGIGCFGPGQKIEQFLISLIDGLPEELKQPLQISVTYTDSLNRPYKNRYTLDFGDFESLVQSDSIEGKAVSDLRPLLDVIQTGFSQVAENIEHLRLPQAPKSMGSATPSQEEEHHQPIQNEQNEPLSPKLQEFVDLYNAGDDAKLRQIYRPFHSIRVSNETDRLENPNVPPVFQTHSSGSFVAYTIDSENLYAVAPFSGFVLQNAFYSSGAFGEVFKCPGFDSQHRYYVKVIRPALFKQDPINETWTLQEKGELELKEKDS